MNEATTHLEVANMVSQCDEKERLTPDTYMAVDKKKARNALEIAYQNMRAAMGESPNIVGFMAQI